MPHRSRGDRPPWPFAINRNSPQARNLFRWWPLVGTMRQEMVTRSMALAGVGSSQPTLQGMPKLGLCPSFNGTNNCFQATVDLSPYGTIALSFWARLTTFANDDDLMFEFTANGGTTTGGFYIDPNSSAPAVGEFSVCTKNASATQSIWKFARPSANVLHHYLFRMDMSVNPNSMLVYVDGVSQSLTEVVPYNASTTTGTFANSTLNFMSRNAGSLFTAGQLTDVRIYTPGVTNCAQLAWSLFRPETRWDLYAVPQRRYVAIPAASGSRPLVNAGLINRGLINGGLVN